MRSSGLIVLLVCMLLPLCAKNGRAMEFLRSLTTIRGKFSRSRLPFRHHLYLYCQTLKCHQNLHKDPQMSYHRPLKPLMKSLET
ncbi:hypothetical protein WN944_002622 [Citrus x changshan-huyou]|uniref:Secreted protein n=1 Tax=Citrus x changshan-huyou TaxID=2935761 RepID=A0AAP0QRY8_9ROSI